jgi:outer membrane protein assembly factor BamB
MMFPMRALALLLAALCAGGPAAAQDWPMLMQGPRHAARANDGVADGAADLARLKLAWRFQVNAEVRASPVAVDGTLYAAAENGNLYAIDVGARRLKWLYHAGGGIGSTPAVDQGRVFFLSRDGRLHAVDAASGAPLWSFRTGGEQVFSTIGMYGQPLDAGPVADPWDFYLSSPLVHDGKIYVGSSDQRVYALDAASGKLAWSYRTGGVIHSSPALAGPNIVVGSWDGAVYALDAASGEQRWRYQTETEQKASIMLGVQASPSVDFDTVYIGSRDGFFYALDAASGQRKWRYDAQGSWIVGTAAQDESSVYVGSSDTNVLLALDKRSGQERFRFDTRAWTYASPLRIGGAVVAGTMKGELHALDAVSGKLLWSYRTPQSAADRDQVLDKNGKFDGDKLYRGGHHAMYSAVEHIKGLGAFLASPIWYRGQLIAATTTGEILFFEAPAAKR